MDARRDRVLEDDDARDRESLVRLERIEQRDDVCLPRISGVLREPGFFVALSPNSSFMSTTSALISVVSAMTASPSSFALPPSDSRTGRARPSDRSVARGREGVASTRSTRARYIVVMRGTVGAPLIFGATVGIWRQ
jgi:hypothetical protein